MASVNTRILTLTVVLFLLCIGTVAAYRTANAAPAGVANTASTAPAPRWSEDDIRASRVIQSAPSDEPASLADEPALSPRVDPMDLLLVIEAGDNHVSVVDGAGLRVVGRFPTRPSLQADPRFTPDGRYAYFHTRDGWIVRYDLRRLRAAGEVRAGRDLRGVAVSADGRWLLAANHQPHTLVLFDADLNLVRTYDVATLDGRAGSGVSAVHDNAPRRSFIAALEDIPEIWEISYDPKAEPVYDGLVHDYKMGEAIGRPGYLNVRRTPLRERLGDFAFDPSGRHVMGVAHPAGNGVQVINLDARVKIADVPVAGRPHPGGGVVFAWNGAPVLASPNQRDGAIDVIDLKTWKIVRTVATPGPASFLRSDPATPCLWTGTDGGKSGDEGPGPFFPAVPDALTIIDKRTLEPVTRLDVPGGALADVGFTRDGRRALVSVGGDDGALVVFDTSFLREIARLPMRKPLGVYRVGGAASGH